MSLNLAVVQARMSFNSTQQTRLCHLCVVMFNLAHPVYIYIEREREREREREKYIYIYIYIYKCIYLYIYIFWMCQTKRHHV